MNHPEPFEVFDPTGKVAGWLANGGVRVWRNVDLSRADLGTLAFTPIDGEKPSWQYELVEQTDMPDRFTFYRKHGTQSAFHVKGRDVLLSIKTEFSDTPAGWKAADRALERIYAEAETEWDAPIGHVKHVYSIERISWTSDEKREDGRPLGYRFTVNVIEWSHIAPKVVEA